MRMTDDRNTRISCEGVRLCFDHRLHARSESAIQIISMSLGTRDDPPIHAMFQLYSPDEQGRKLSKAKTEREAIEMLNVSTISSE